MAACSLALALQLLLLLQDIQTSLQTSLTPSHSCDTRGNWFYDETSQSCCYQCPSGSVKKKACPENPTADCMRCGPGQFVNTRVSKLRCDACVLCKRELDLVEKEPCSFNSSSVCECRPGLFCQTSGPYTCARCQPHTTCQPGFGVRVRGTSTRDVTCEECPAGTFSDQSSSTDSCKPHTDCAKLNKVALSQGNATHDQVCLDQLPTYLTQSPLSTRFSNETNHSDPRSPEESLVTIAGGDLLSATTTENPSSAPEEKDLTFPTSAKGEMTMGGVVLWAVVLCVIVLLGAMLFFWKWKVCKKRILVLKGKPHLHSVIAHKYGLKSPEKLYIMKADTVIVGSVAEVPGGKNCPARGCESNTQEIMEEELGMHYPEQETESFPGNDVMVPVEEEGKEFHHPTTATEK
ncbi:tumor necrosis factor receptor superfamily member 8 [Manacus vitellinus]|uniref:tumor necrosis factor receptor superfamily member 8 n=1 Tax=Manacus vitellinus TaxID=328815 RepID=UPI00115C7EBC|nr:tumor necrosis factor receptor superfamily member 8 [Manacus vitellinus]